MRALTEPQMSTHAPQEMKATRSRPRRREERDVIIMAIYLVEAQLIGGRLLRLIGLEEEKTDGECYRSTSQTPVKELLVSIPLLCGGGDIQGVLFAA